MDMRINQSGQYIRSFRVYSLVRFNIVPSLQKSGYLTVFNRDTYVILGTIFKNQSAVVDESIICPLTHFLSAPKVQLYHMLIIEELIRFILHGDISSFEDISVL